MINVEYYPLKVKEKDDKKSIEYRERVRYRQEEEEEENKRREGIGRTWRVYICMGNPKIHQHQHPAPQPNKPSLSGSTPYLDISRPT